MAWTQLVVAEMRGGVLLGELGGKFSRTWKMTGFGEMSRGKSCQGI